MCTNAIVGRKFMPTCVRGYADRRLGTFYTLHGNFLANSYDFGSAMVSSFVSLVTRLDGSGVKAGLFGQSLCRHAGGVMAIGAWASLNIGYLFACNILLFQVNNGV